MVHIRGKTPERWTKNQKFWEKNEKNFWPFLVFCSQRWCSTGETHHFGFLPSLWSPLSITEKIFKIRPSAQKRRLKDWKKVRFFPVFWLGWDHGGEPGGRYWYQTIGFWETYHPPTFHPPTSKDLDFSVKKPKNFPDFWHRRAPYHD